MPSFQQTINALDPTILRILDISNTDRCSLYCWAQYKRFHATYHKPATGKAQRDEQCEEGLLFQCASLFKVFIAASLVLIIDRLSSDPNTKHQYSKLEGAWQRPFTEVFNDLIGAQGSKMRSLPGDPNVLQLLLHSNGVYDMNHIFLAPDATPLQGLHDVVERISQYAKDTYGEHGEEQSSTIYSNSNYVLLSLLVDKASGSLNEFLKEYIFKPFKMERTFLNLEDLRSHSKESLRQPHVVSSDGYRRIFRPGTTLGLRDLVEIAWLGPYISAVDLGLFFEGLLSARDGKPIGLFNKAVVESLGYGRSDIEVEYTPCGLLTSLSSTGPGSHSLNRLISPDSTLKTHIPGKRPDGELRAFYLAGSATGWAGTVYFLPYKRTFVIALTNISGPLDASELISRLCLHEIFKLPPPKASHWDFGSHLSGQSNMTSAERHEYYIALARRIFDENALKIKELEQLDNQPDTRTSDCPDLPGKYYCSRNGQYLHLIDWKSEDNQNTEGVLRIVIQSGMKSSQKLRFAKRDGKFRICSPETFFDLAIDCFDAWANLEFEIERDNAGVKSLSRQGKYLKDFFVREKS